MTEQWVRNTLTPHIVGDFLILSRYSDGSIQQAIEISTFVELFSSVTEPTYENLKNADQGKGYIPFFDQWKAESLIN